MRGWVGGYRFMAANTGVPDDLIILRKWKGIIF
jgi:hypothetical protein